MELAGGPEADSLSNCDISCFISEEQLADDGAYFKQAPAPPPEAVANPLHHSVVFNGVEIDSPLLGPKEPAACSQKDLLSLQAEICSHPMYPRLVRAHFDCRKVGQPQEVVAELQEQEVRTLVALEAAAPPEYCLGGLEPRDPELDAFLAQYCMCLEALRDDLYRMYHDASSVIELFEHRLQTLAEEGQAPPAEAPPGGLASAGVGELHSSAMSIVADNQAALRCDVGPASPAASSEVVMAASNGEDDAGRMAIDQYGHSSDPEAAGGAGPDSEHGSSEGQPGSDGLDERGGHPAGLPRAEGQLIRERLKSKHARSILSLKNEFLKRRKKGKLPKDATQLLKNWWCQHILWPYPSEDDKRSLAAMSQLSPTQINNWFINQRKRHWHKLFAGGPPSTPDEAKEALRARYGSLELAMQVTIEKST